MNMLRYFGLIILCCVWACTPAESPTPIQPGASPSPSASNAPQPAITVLADDLALPEPEILSEAEWLELTQSELVDAINAYGIKQFQAHYAAHAEQNTLFSPFSVGWNLLIQANLAQGEAREQLLSQLELKDHDLQRINRLAGLLRREVYRNGIENIYYNPATQDPVKENVLRADPVHGLWLSPDTEISAATIDTLHQNYGVRVVKADFQAQPAAVAEALNTWIQARTQGELPPQWQPEQIAQQKNLLWSTFYFQALWWNAFEEPNLYSPISFYLPNKSEIQAPSMFATLTSFRYFQDGMNQTQFLSNYYFHLNSHHVLYKEPLLNLYECIFALPAANKDLQNEIQALSHHKWNHILKGLYSATGQVEIPRFSISSNPVQKSKLIKQDYSLNSILHPIQFQNLGTGTFNVDNGPKRTRDFFRNNAFTFEANRPFLFSVYHSELRLILNIGTVIDPRGGNQP